MDRSLRRWKTRKHVLRQMRLAHRWGLLSWHTVNVGYSVAYNMQGEKVYWPYRQWVDAADCNGKIYPWTTKEETQKILKIQGHAKKHKIADRWYRGDWDWWYHGKLDKLRSMDVSFKEQMEDTGLLHLIGRARGFKRGGYRE